MFGKCKGIFVVTAAVILAVWLQCPDRAAGWGSGGHLVVANIAYDQLKPGTRSRVVEVLRKHEDFKKRFQDKMPDDIRTGNVEDQDRWIFLQAAIWPDLIRTSTNFHRPTWHYVNKPFFLSSVDEKALQGVIKPNVRVDLPDPLSLEARKSLNGVQAFKLCVKELTDADVTDEERAVYYCWLLHIGGDLHQPLHSTSLISRARFNESEGDRGGNGIKVKQGKNLHSYWDGLLGGNQTLNDIRGRAKDIVDTPELFKAGEEAAKKLAVEDWLAESHKLARECVYHPLILKEVAAREADPSQPLQKVNLPLAYREMAGELAQRRVAEAGFRLAKIIQQIED